MTELTIELSHSCPCRCYHCSSQSNIGMTMSWDDVITHIDEYGPHSVRISGGEPLMWSSGTKTAGDIGRYLREQNVPSLLLTSGVGSGNEVEEMRQFDGVAVSLYGNEPVHASVVRPDDRELGKRYYWKAVRLILEALRWCKRCVIHTLGLSRSVETLNPFIDTLARTYHGNFEVRGFKLLSHYDWQSFPSPNIQWEYLEKVHHIKFSHSFGGKCHIADKITVLPSGRAVHCSANKVVDLGICQRRCDIVRRGGAG